MNIRSVQTGAAAQTPQPLTTVAPKSTNTQPVEAQVTGDSFQPAQNEKLVNTLKQEPDVRSEAVERAKAMVADPNYPGTDTIAKLASLFISDSNSQE
jgi:hypothetical protein